MSLVFFIVWTVWLICQFNTTRIVSFVIVQTYGHRWSHIALEKLFYVKLLLLLVK